MLPRKKPVEVPNFKPSNIAGQPTNSIQGEWHERHGLIGLDFEIEHVYSADDNHAVASGSSRSTTGK